MHIWETSSVTEQGDFSPKVTKIYSQETHESAIIWNILQVYLHIYFCNLKSLQTVLTSKNKGEGITLPDTKAHYRAKIIKTVQ